MKLIIDTRERAIIDQLDAVIADKKHALVYEIEQINTGDFIIMTPTNVPVACIERKTYSDLFASFRDGRYGNKEKMIKFREEYKCDLYYIIEGKYDLVSGVYENAVFAENYLMSVDKMFVLHTENQIDTINRLASLLITYTKHIPVIGAVELKRDDLTKVIENTDADIIKCWSSLPGISQVSSDIIARATSIRGLTYEIIEDLRTANGSKFTEKAKTSLKNVILRDTKTIIGILAAIRGISAITAKKIVETIEQYDMDLYNLELVELKKHVKITAKQIEILNKFLNHKIPDTAT